MAYSAYAVANAFIERAQEQSCIPNLTPMKLQKLLYFTQAWHLKRTGVPILDDNFARWQYGPVIPAIYHEFKAYGDSSINHMATTLAMNNDNFAMRVPIIPPEDTNTWSLIDAIINRYGKSDAQTLSDMTHAKGSAWSNKTSPDGSVITAQEIRDDPTI